MSRIQRWRGLDLFRGFAVYAVILLHADEEMKQAPEGWNAIVTFSGFAVPFFLAASFFLASKRLFSSGQPYPLKDRIYRLIVPYIFWTFFYVAYKFLKYAFDGDLEKVKKLFLDPMGIIFFGGAAFHLYFIPLLIVGTFLLKAFDLIKIKSISPYKTFVLGAVSMILYQILLASNNEFNLVTLSAFEPLLKSVSSEGLFSLPPVRFLSVVLAWLIRCLPYLFMAILIYQNKAVQSRLLQPSRLNAWIIVMVFCLLNGAGHLILPSAVHEVLRGYSAVLAAIALSNILESNSTITGIGMASFGIYLMHLLVLEVFQTTSNRLDILDLSNPSLITLFSISTLSFIVTWLSTMYLLRFKQLSRWIFGS